MRMLAERRSVEQGQEGLCGRGKEIEKVLLEEV